MYPYGKFPGGGPLVSIVGFTPSSSFFSGFVSNLGIILLDADVDKSVLFEDSALNSGLTLMVGVELGLESGRDC